MAAAAVVAAVGSPPLLVLEDKLARVGLIETRRHQRISRLISGYRQCAIFQLVYLPLS